MELKEKDSQRISEWLEKYPEQKAANYGCFERDSELLVSKIIANMNALEERIDPITITTSDLIQLHEKLLAFTNLVINEIKSRE